MLLFKEEGWVWVPPRPWLCYCQSRRAMMKFTNGLLRSRTHCVVQPPIEQSGLDRYSVVYFERPNDDVKLHPLTKDAGSLEDYPTSKEWIERRVLGEEKNHYKGEKEYLAGRGTETAAE
jgi:isopenicillin N synthase-like dioxygenase